MLRGFYQRQQDRPQTQGADWLKGAGVVPFASTALILPLFILAIFKLSAESYSAFLYFQF
jgi:hypothetical protein